MTKVIKQPDGFTGFLIHTSFLLFQEMKNSVILSLFLLLLPFPQNP